MAATVYVFILIIICEVLYAYDFIKKYLSNSTDAKCLDGSIPIYYIRKGTGTGKNKWILYFQGGGWCFDLQSCYRRSFTAIGTSSRDKLMTLSYNSIYLNASYLTDDYAINPMMYNWNTVYIRYCDGTSYTGNIIRHYKDKILYFHGLHNRDETVKQLLIKEQMIDGNEIVISGCSAGGLSIYYGIDQMRDIIHSYQNQSSLAIIRGLSDSGFFPNKSGTDMDSFQSLFYLANMSAGINKHCLSKHSDKTGCLYAENLLPYIETPIFSMQSKYDAWQLRNILESKNYSHINAFGNHLYHTMNVTFHLSSKDHGFYIDSCSRHCYSCIALNYYPNNFWIYNNQNPIPMKDLSEGLVNPFYAFYLWYNALLSNSTQKLVNNHNIFNQVIPGINWFVQNDKYPARCLCKIAAPYKRRNHIK